jgi:hypothetical protein
VNSFTSIFDGRRGGQVRKICLTFVVTFSGLMGLGHWMAVEFPEWTSSDPCPSGYQGADSFSIFVFHGLQERLGTAFYDVRGEMRWARKADILIMGNSRSEMGFRDIAVRRFEKSTGLRIYNLSFAGNNCDFMSTLMEKNQLFPRLILLNQDSFFASTMGGEEKTVMGDSEWHVRSNIYAGYAQWLVKDYVDKLMPALNILRADWVRPYSRHYSPFTGCILSYDPLWKQGSPLGAKLEDGFIKPQNWGSAREFVKRMRDRGAQVVLIKVPNRTNAERVVCEAKALGVPVITPKVSDLRTMDGDHLNQVSADRFADAVFKELVRLPQFEHLRIQGTAK